MLIVAFFFILTVIYLFPLLHGLILLPLDLLISNYLPWYSPATILIKNPYMQDSITQMFPWKHFVFTSLHQGIIPWWNPYQFAGMPFMASLKPMIFYPFSIFYLLGEIPAWHILLFFQIFFSLCFTYLFARSMKLSKVASILAAFGFSFSTLMIGVLEFGSEGHVLLWFPLMLFFSKQFIENKKSHSLLLLGLMIALSILAGQLQYTAYLLIAIVIFIFWYGKTQHTRFISYFLLLMTIALGIGITAFQLFPTLQLFNGSYRGLQDAHQIFSSSLIYPYQLLRLFSPDLFGNPSTNNLAIGYIESSGYFGAILFFFAVYAMWVERKNIFVQIFSIFFILSAILCLKGFGDLLYVLHIPLITSGQGERIFSLGLFSGPILAGFGFDTILKNWKKQSVIFLIIFTIVYGFIVLHEKIIHPENAPYFIKNLAYPFAIFIVFVVVFLSMYFLRKKIVFLKSLFVLLTLILVFGDLFRVGYRFLTFSNIRFFYPQMPAVTYLQKISYRNMGRVYGITQPELATYLRLYTAETYNPLYSLQTAQSLNAIQQIPLNSLQTNKYFLTPGRPQLEYAWNVLGYRYIAIRTGGNPAVTYLNDPLQQSSFDLIYHDDRYDIFINKNANRRYDLFYNVTYVRENKILSVLSQQKIDLKTTVLLSQHLPLSLHQGTGTITFVKADQNSQTFSIQTNKPALFYISDSYYPGWKATINGKSTLIYKANGIFRAVLIPTGKSILVFSYIPSYFWLGVGVSIISFILLLVIVSLQKFRIIRI